MSPETRKLGSVPIYERLRRASQYSIAGLIAAFRDEQAFRLETYGLLALTTVACLVPVSFFERLLLVGSLLPILVAELLNAAVEAVVDLASPERHPLAKKAKDCASAAVMVAMFGAITTWIGVLANGVF